MNADEFARLKEVVLRAADLPESERSAYLAKACPDPDLRRQAEALLAHDPGGVESGAEDTTTLLPTPSEASSELEQQIGPYRLLEKIGEGGMGVVYVAEQQEPVRRKVALKVIKRGMDTRQVIARFEAERQALALMEHPNIARVFDAGTTPGGRPYFVMEYVKGIPITTYCDKYKLTTDERLELFMQVCDGVQHAHQKAIIHRDLKPSNILVAVGDAKPVPKIIDFGVAKATTQKLTEKTVFTALGELIGTPEYMSPEQAEMTGEDVDTRTDVYSLGVLLYELLAGGLPFEPEELRRAGYQGILRMIREQDPPKPSTKVSTLGERRTQIAASRRTAPGKLSSLLRGDLDWITMKSLEKDRTRRYASAAELAGDVQRHLRHEPVAAGPPDAGYRMRKFVRRHHVGVVTGSIVAASLIVAVVISVRFALGEAEQRRVAARERDIAQAVNDFLNNDLLAAVAPSAEKGKGKDVLMRDVLNEAAKRIDEEEAVGGKFEGKPLVVASIRTTLGETYLKLGEYDAAVQHLERARELRRQQLGEENPETQSTSYRLAVLYARQGRLDEAEPLFQKTLEIRKHILGEEDPETLKSMNGLAIVYKMQGRFEEAARLYQRTVDIQLRVLGRENPSTLSTMNNLGNLYVSQGRYDDAEPLYLEVLQSRRHVLGDEAPPTLDSMTNLAGLYADQGRYDQAQRLYAEALEIKTRILGEEHPKTLATMADLATVYHEQAQYTEAEHLYRKTLQVQEHTLGDEHPTTLNTMTCLATVYLDQRRYDAAESLSVKVLEIKKRVQGEEHPSTLLSMNNLGLLYLKQERYDEAERLIRKTVELRTRVLGGEHPYTLGSMHNLALVYASEARYDSAEPLYLKTLEIENRVLGEEHPRTLAALRDYCSTLIALTRYDDAERRLLESYTTLLGSKESDHRLMSQQIESLIGLYEAWGKPEVAAEWRAKLPAKEQTAKN